MGRKQGFTLLEILLVIALLGLLAVAVIPKVGAVFRTGATSSVRRFSALVRFTYDQSVLTGKVHRIVLNMDDRTWKVEAADPGALPIDKTRMGLLPEGLREEDRQLSEPGFKPAGGGVVDAMPRGVKIVSVQSWRTGKDPVTKGSVSIYAFPNGMVDEAEVQLAEEGKEDQQTFKIKTNALTGRVQVETENKRP